MQLLRYIPGHRRQGSQHIQTNSLHSSYVALQYFRIGAWEHGTLPGLSVTSNAMGRGHLLGWCSALQPPLYAQDFFSSGKWIDVDLALQGSDLGSLLFG